jgi:glycosyltransferase involved in cell wall biosynthesis
LFPTHKQKAKIIRRFVEKTEYDFIFTRYIPRAMEFGLADYADKLVVDVDDLLQGYFKIIANASNTKSAKFRNNFFSFWSNFNTKKFVGKINAAVFTNACDAKHYGGNYVPNIPFYENTCNSVNFATTKKRLFFVGNLSYFPNYSGISYFLENIYSNLKKRLPDVEFYIAGALNDNELRTKWNTFSDVKLLGKIDDLQAEYEQARAVAVPIYQGAGTNIKVVEALQMNRACALSDFATRGFSEILEDGKDYLIAKNDNDFINNLEKLLTDENFNAQIAENGCKKVKKYFSFEAFREKVMKIFKIYE